MWYVVGGGEPIFYEIDEHVYIIINLLDLSLTASYPLNRLPIPKPQVRFFKVELLSYMAWVYGLLTVGNLFSLPKLKVVFAVEKLIVSALLIMPPRPTLG